MRRALPLIAVVLAALSAPTVRADQASRSSEALSGDRAQVCRFLLGRDDPTCNVDGYDLSEANVAEYEASWTHRALELQRQLDLHAPLKDELLPHTHNSFNSEAYTPSLSRLDHNQLLSLTDQLRLDMRAIEIDVHRAPSVTEGRVGVVACHAEPVGPVHAGCTNEEPLSAYLTELRDWLDANRDEFVLLYLENNLDGDPAAHDEAAGNISEILGARVFKPARPAPAECASMPYDVTRAEILATAQVLIVGNCGPGAWGDWVHERGPDWDESSNPAGDDYSCSSERARTDIDYDRQITRRYEDRTWLTAMAGGEGGITEKEMAAMVACGVNLVGFDMLHPDDARLDDLVWSWAPGEPSAPGCAAQRADGRFVSAPCTQLRRAACYDGAGWRVTRQVVRFASAAAACDRAGARFAPPWNGWENGRLLAAGGGDVWVGYAGDDSGWKVERTAQ